MSVNGHPAPTPTLRDPARCWSGLERPWELLAMAKGENFTVASLLLPAREREALLAIYGFARLVDQLGDVVGGNRLEALDWLERELDLAFQGRANHPLLRRLAVQLAAHDLPKQPFLRLIEANRVDQRKARYRTIEELLAYCDLSANPVGELVLCLYGHRDRRRIELSNRVCTALQLIEHLQDVGEDYRRGRVYLPLADLERFGVLERDLGGRTTPPALRQLLAFEADRARGLLGEGEPLVGLLAGSARLAVAGYLAGGYAALARLEEGRFAVLERDLGGSASARRARETAALLGRAAAGRVGPRPLLLAAGITRREAANFYYGIRLLDRPRRLALCAVYAFARLVDDIGDGDLPRERKLAQLERVERQLAAALRGENPGWREPALAALAAALRRYQLPADQLQALIDGVRMDVVGASFDTVEQLLGYCEKVASSVGRLALSIYGLKRGAAARWAYQAAAELGLALQLTNVLRDLREDAQRGRLYLPRHELERFGLLVEGEAELVGALAAGRLDPQRRAYLAALVGELAGRAQNYFERGLSLVDQLDHRAAACVLAMAGIYRETLARIERDPLAPLRGRVGLSVPAKGAVVASALGGLPR